MQQSKAEVNILHTIQKIESTLELPYRLIDWQSGSEHFIFQFQAFDENQTDISIQNGGITGAFGVMYQGTGISCAFTCDITIGNVYDFYISLDNAYDIMYGKNAVAVLKNYGETLHRTNLTFSFDSKGHCSVSGYFQNKENRYHSGITFAFELDQTYIPEILHRMDQFFQEIRRIQGHGQFY